MAFLDDIRFIGNESTRTVHKIDCIVVLDMWVGNIVPFVHLYDAEGLGYCNCQFCMPDEDNNWKEKKYIYELCKSKRKEPCVICGEVRGVQLAHVVPKRHGGMERVMLCPTCHWNYDHNLLENPEREVLIEHLVSSNIPIGEINSAIEQLGD